MLRQIVTYSFLLAGLAGSLLAQTAPPFAYRVQQGSTITTLTDGGTVNLVSEAVGQPVNASLVVTYRGTQSVTINNIDYSGAVEFQIVGAPEFPITLNREQSFNVAIRFVPSNSNRFTGRIATNYTEGRTNGVTTLNLVGTAPEFAFSFIPQGGNAVLLSNGGTANFPLTAIDATNNGVIVALNRGTAPGTVKSIGFSGNPAFQLTGLPLPDTTVEPTREIRFNVAFTPKQLDPVSGQVNVTLFNSQFGFNVQGSGSGPVFAYESVQGDTSAPLAPTGLVTVPDIAVNEKSTALVRFRNTGNAEGRITQIGIQGAGFSLLDQPFLPLVLQPGQSSTVTIQFAPTQPGRQTGRLRIGNDVFDLSASGLGAILGYSYQAGPVTTNVAAGATVTLTPAAVGRTSSLRFLINNTGTSAAPVNSIAITGGNNVFTLADLPGLPAEVPAGGNLGFTVNFAPNALTTATATLRIDSQTFTLSGTGTTPAPIPEFRIEGASGNQQPLQQPSVGLTLASPYTLRLNGVLTLALNSGAFTNDPAVQFATGGRTVNFTIPAGSTRAVFPDGSNQVRLQTGSVAGTIGLTPSFTTEGGVDLTPSGVAPMNLTVPQSAPQILSVIITNRSANGFTLQVTGYSTSRSINQMDVEFRAVSGENLQTTRVSLNVASSFLAWYQSQTSQQFGSLFTLTVPFSMTGDVKTTNFSLIDTLQSASVTLTNAQGASQPRSVDFK